MAPLNPPVRVAWTPVVAEPPGATLTDGGVPAMAKPLAFDGFTKRSNETVASARPGVFARSVIVASPISAFAPTVKVTVELVPLTDAGTNDAVTPVGRFSAVSASA